jgi:hypothetical protein
LKIDTEAIPGIMSRWRLWRRSNWQSIKNLRPFPYQLMWSGPRDWQRDRPHRGDALRTERIILALMPKDALLHQWRLIEDDCLHDG